MRYRIKITTFKNGRTEYVAQVKKFFGWVNLDFEGEPSVHITGICDNRTSALWRIDKHFEGNTQVQKIDFEFIDR